MIFQNNMLVSQSSGTGPATFQFTAMESGYWSLDVTPPGGEAGSFSLGGGVSYDSQSAAAYFGVQTPDAVVQVSFSATYESIMPNGQIVVGNGSSATVVIEQDYVDGQGDGTDSFVDFTALIVPEPASIVPAALAVLMLVTFAWIRGFRLRSWLRLS